MIPTNLMDSKTLKTLKILTDLTIVIATSSAIQFLHPPMCYLTQHSPGGVYGLKGAINFGTP